MIILGINAYHGDVSAVLLRDGELVILILKPSLWYIFFNLMFVAAVALIGIISAKLWAPYLLWRGRWRASVVFHSIK